MSTMAARGDRMPVHPRVCGEQSFLAAPIRPSSLPAAPPILAAGPLRRSLALISTDAFRSAMPVYYA